VAYYSGYAANQDEEAKDGNDFLYAMFDPLQTEKPSDRTKDIISYFNREQPQRLDTVDHLGCDTVWKCFKRSVWRNPDGPFLGERQYISNGPLDKYNINFNKANQKLGEYQWQTFKETDDIVEALANTIVKRKLCPEIKSNVEGTPDCKFMGIFSENRAQWFMTELACCSDSICVVPVAIENQFVNENRITSLLNNTELVTLCVSRKTIGVILDLKSQEKLKYLKNIIVFDQTEDMHITLAT
jgi:hypothetical protein